VIATVTGRNVDSHDTGIIGTVFVSGDEPARRHGGTGPGRLGRPGAGLPHDLGRLHDQPFGVATLTPLAASDLTNGTTGTGAVVLATSPTLVTPDLGVATATSINGVTITPTTGTITSRTARRSPSAIR
jgi:hypothetical protein